MMEFQEFLLVLEGFGRKPGGNHKKSLKTHKFYIKFMFFLNDFLNDFLMGSKGVGKVPASKWCKMQQNQWFSLVFQGFTKQNDGIPGVFASFGRFWQDTRWKS